MTEPKNKGRAACIFDNRSADTTKPVCRFGIPARYGRCQISGAVDGQATTQTQTFNQRRRPMAYRTSLTSPVFGLRREIDRLFEDTFAGNGAQGWTPSVNIRESADALAFEVELPGLKSEQVEVTCDNGVLTIRGERRDERKEGEEGRYHLIERSYGSFSRSFQLPQNVDEDQIQASFEDGMLMVRVPKGAIPQPRRIEIQGRRQVQQGRSNGGHGREGNDGGDRKNVAMGNDSEGRKTSGSGNESRQRATSGSR
jgi:HSP20 family protein